MDGRFLQRRNQSSKRKDILLDVQDITVGAFVMARLNSRKYRGEVKDLLEWSAHRRRNAREKQEGA